jgi:hypothetical protein
MRLLKLVLDRLVLLQSECWFAVGNAALKAITLHETCGEGYHKYGDSTATAVQDWGQDSNLVFECKDLSAAEIHLLVRVDGKK